MKRILMTIATGILIGFLLVSCKTEKSGITMSVTPDRLENVPSSITLVVVNNTNDEINYGAHCTIEELQGEEWVRMPFNDQLSFIELQYTQPAGETREHIISLYPEMANYKKGQYRIKKRINKGDQQHEAVAVFEVL